MEDLARRIAHGGIENYSKVRHKKDAAVIKMVKRQTIMFTSSRPGPRFMARQVLPMILRFTPIRKRLLRLMAGLR